MAVHYIDHERPVDVRVGDLELRLAENAAEIDAAQALRYRVFYEEMGAEPSADMARKRRDADSFDDYCDHLLVIDRKRGIGPAGVVATYRLLRREAAARRGQFYSIDEFDVAPILSYKGEILELGRSCVAKEYRSRAAMQLLWRGIADYIGFYEIGVMFGCASLSGTDPQALAMPLSYLYHHHLAPADFRPRAKADRYVAMNILPRDQIDERAALDQLPPLLKGYLRLGGFIGDGAVIDRPFNTTDVCVVVRTDTVSERYRRHYQRDES